MGEQLQPVVHINDDYSVDLLTVGSGDWKLINDRKWHGFILIGWGGESQLTILISALQSGKSNVMVALSQCNSNIEVRKVKVPWDKEEVAVNKIICILLRG